MKVVLDVEGAEGASIVENQSLRECFTEFRSTWCSVVAEDWERICLCEEREVRRWKHGDSGGLCV